ncbi:hypothetical protein AGMMS50293_21120 [Spirochaetia bacterium]|nr:hypothetical protein AGMMS50293_21120 [Spirochaetia bacterium]
MAPGTLFDLPKGNAQGIGGARSVPGAAGDGAIAEPRKARFFCEAKKCAQVQRKREVKNFRNER